MAASILEGCKLFIHKVPATLWFGVYFHGWPPLLKIKMKEHWLLNIVPVFQ